MIDPTRIDDLSTPIVDVYRRAELYLVEVIRRALIRTGESPDWARAQLLAIRQERGNIQGLATVLQKRLPMWHTAVSEAWTRGQLDAEAEMVQVPEDKTPIPSPVPISLNTEAVVALTTEAMNTMTPVHRGILRATDDIWRRINAEATGYVLTGSMTPYQAAKRSFTRMTREGLPFFTDKRGRKWGLDTYAEMAVRTATNQALRAGHEDTMRSYGVDLMVVSSHKNPAPQCAPYERKVLSLGKYSAGSHRIGDNIVQVKATMDDAVAHGFRHPNAILGGEQSIDTFAGAVGASKSAYRGPAVVISTAHGHSMTVSPHHPVLTSKGWRTAKSLSAGDYLFNPVLNSSSSNGRFVESDIDNVPSSVEDRFIALKLSGTCSSIPSAGYNFNDDRKFIQGEIDVVMTDDCLLAVPDIQIVKESGEVHFVWPDMSGGREVGDSPEAFGSSSVGLPFSVAGALSNINSGRLQMSTNCSIGHVEHGGDLLGTHAGLVHVDDSPPIDRFVGREIDTAFNKPISHSRLGDSQDPGTVAKAIPGGIQADKVIAVDFIDFSGHAYDFQTVDGVYSVNSIIVHNCRHRVSAYIPGFTRTSDVPYDGDDTGYKATQKQRYLERQIRRSKMMEAAAIDETDVREARMRIRNYQKKLRDHVGEHDLPRRRHREQVRLPDSGGSLSFDD